MSGAPPPPPPPFTHHALVYCTSVIEDIPPYPASPLQPASREAVAKNGKPGRSAENCPFTDNDHPGGFLEMGEDWKGKFLEALDLVTYKWHQWSQPEHVLKIADAHG